MIRRITTFVSGLVAGVAVGAVVTQLLTPQTGDERQKALQQYSQRLKENSQQAAETKRQALQAELAQKLAPSDE